MLTFLTYFVLVINGNRINRFHLFWDTLYLITFQSMLSSKQICYTTIFRVLIFSPKIIIFLLLVFKVFILEEKQHQQKKF